MPLRRPIAAPALSSHAAPALACAILPLLLLSPTAGLGQAVQGYARHPDTVAVQVGAGMLQIRPLADNAVRIRHGPDLSGPELIPTGKPRMRRFRVTQSAAAIVVSTSQLRVVGFRSPADEALFGLGQFQDGHFDLRRVTRRLTQVNSRISESSRVVRYSGASVVVRKDR